MDDNILRYTLRVNRTLFQKFRYVADYEGRSANRDLMNAATWFLARTLAI